jgi:ABC-type glycerol-3-phosphate transport system substrate-binding protein
VPTAPNWVKVENARVLKTLIQDIVTGRKSVAKAAKDASARITKILNQPVT